MWDMNWRKKYDNWRYCGIAPWWTFARKAEVSQSQTGDQVRFLQKSETSSVQTLAQLWLALVGNILLYMVNIDGYYMVNDGQ